MQFATLDIVIVAVVLLSAAIGLVRGLVKEVLSLAAWGLAFIAAIYFAPTLAPEFPDTWGGESVRTVIAFALIFVITLIAAGVARWLIAQLVEATGLSSTDRLLGFVFGGLRGLLICVVGLIALQQIASDAQWWHASVLQGELLAFEDDVTSALAAVREFFSDSAAGLSGAAGGRG